MQTWKMRLCKTLYYNMQFFFDLIEKVYTFQRKSKN